MRRARAKRSSEPIDQDDLRLRAGIRPRGTVWACDCQSSGFPGFASQTVRCNSRRLVDSRRALPQPTRSPSPSPNTSPRLLPRPRTFGLANRPGIKLAATETTRTPPKTIGIAVASQTRSQNHGHRERQSRRLSPWARSQTRLAERRLRFAAPWRRPTNRARSRAQPGATTSRRPRGSKRLRSASRH
jgi:hypothetical protein